MNGFVTFKVDMGALSRASADDAGLLLGALASLPGRTRSVLLLRRFDGMSCSEIAGRLQMSERDVEAEIAAGLAALVA